jgi:hypothetical protein
MRSFGEAEAVGVDITRRCWECDCSELIEKCDDTGLGEFVRRREGIDSGDDMTFDEKEAGEGSEMGTGRRLLRLARSAGTTKVRLKPNKPKQEQHTAASPNVDRSRLLQKSKPSSLRDVGSSLPLCMITKLRDDTS